MRKIILGTDWWTDVDDCVAARLLCNAHNKGEIEFIGVCLNACMEYSAPSVSAFLTYHGLENIPIGIDLEANDFYGDFFAYQKPMCDNFAHRIKTNEECENGVDLYRRLLTQATEKVDIIEIGFLQVLAALLNEKDGVELVKEKVGHIYVMAGKWDIPKGKEHNFCNNQRSRYGGRVFCEKCPVPVTFLGHEVGDTVRSGNGLPENDILGMAIRAHRDEEKGGRQSWDPMTVLLALDEDIEKAGYTAVYGKASVDEATGENDFAESEDGMHCYVVKAQPDSWYRERIQALI